MLILGAHIIFAVFGITALAQQKVSLSRTTVIRGRPARIIGILAILTYPLASVFGFAYGFHWGSTRPTEDPPFVAGLVVNGLAFAVVGIAIAVVVYRCRAGAEASDKDNDESDHS